MLFIVLLMRLLYQRNVERLVDIMSLEGEGSIYEHAKGRVVIYVPALVHKDSAFPFEIGAKVIVRIDKNRLVVELKGAE